MSAQSSPVTNRAAFGASLFCHGSPPSCAMVARGLEISLQRRDMRLLFDLQFSSSASDISIQCQVLSASHVPNFKLLSHLHEEYGPNLAHFGLRGLSEHTESVSVERQQHCAKSRHLASSLSRENRPSDTEARKEEASKKEGPRSSRRSLSRSRQAVIFHDNAAAG